MEGRARESKEARKGFIGSNFSVSSYSALGRESLFAIRDKCARRITKISQIPLSDILENLGVHNRLEQFLDRSAITRFKAGLNNARI